ncbi:Wzz/FepE/Etk N-terminal domain-containing protein [Algoriphagus machipongonensis]|uniref:Chain length determinant protein n=1 Tax=Algoriphagus machipongonensis TaxID=388413 RepID=A3I1X6_9BACT|nr:Wzz/FepE/Etk N-terminal domain-containing protein [Algoriphagus machipongonensis]EAZ79792.1 putative chain length determinant protein [Algoriphagus machipongonensis]
MKQKIEKILLTNDFTLVNLVRLGKAKMRVLVGSVILFVLFGFIYYATTPDSYSTQTVLLVESQNANAAGGLGSLAQVAGLSMQGSQSELGTLDPALYPMIIQSKPFLQDLMNSKVKSDLYPDSVSLYKYIIENNPDNKIYRAVKRPFSIFKDNIIVDDKEREVMNNTSRTQYEPLELYALYQLADGIIASSEGTLLLITTTMPEAKLSYQFSVLVKKLLVEYATRYLQEKQKSHVDYLEVQYEKSEEGFREAQNALTSFKERNQGLYLESLKAREQNLNAEYNLKFELYRTIAKELESSRIELNNQKPIFSEIEPPFIPNKPVAPNLLIIISFCIALGFIFGLVFIFILYIRQYMILHQNHEID